jgi:hypothetical protein
VRVREAVGPVVTTRPGSTPPAGSAAPPADVTRLPVTRLEFQIQLPPEPNEEKEMTCFERDLEIIRLHDEKQTRIQIAEQLGCTVKTVHHALYRAERVGVTPVVRKRRADVERLIRAGQMPSQVAEELNVPLYKVLHDERNRALFARWRAKVAEYSPTTS